MRPRVVLVTSAGPYLGGPLTWAPLRDAAPDIDFIAIDPLDFADARPLEAVARRTIAAALDGADAIVAHSSVAHVVIEVVATVNPALPVLLLSPAIVQRRTAALRAVRAIVIRPPASWALVAFARSKLRRLRRDRAYVRAQLALFVGGAALSDALIDEAEERIGTTNTERVVARTAEFLAYALDPLDPELDAKVSHRTVLLGSGPLDRATARRMPATIVPNVTGAPMLEAPEAVARALRILLEARE